ncbi:MAG TPA: bifunctional phosphoribosyl-AMP cyclohydrolase/phosphoribosyl-ATP diphosphatase HisIE [Steroidobacteraceae bacterium]|nr:bifunctional phosphoribosyl-AMP cyclohydrolase/phosphoribosyl-ATP diphosphatase HisIE [Steroidobacteraceae bacterium]
MTPEQIRALDWNKGDGLLPAVIQHAVTGAVLMLGFMNRQALTATVDAGRVVFYSRRRQALWLKGETSGHFLNLVGIAPDCDNDTLLVQALPAGPVCHVGTPTCFIDVPPTDAERLAFLADLERVIAQRIAERPEGSYTARLVVQGQKRMAQKVGEEGLEVALAAAGGEDKEVISESADLLYHLLLLLKSRNLSLKHVVDELASRHGGHTPT